MTKQILERFLRLESASSILLLLSAILSFLWVNSSLAKLHTQFIDTFLFTINDGLMAIFFLAVGLELKRGYLEGRLTQLSQIALPLGGAIGGMLIPALIYYCINYNNPLTLRGWATPVATDIAFALGVLALFGRRVPPALKLFLVALAIFDDVGAILIIAIFLSTGFSIIWLVLSAMALGALYLLNRFNINHMFFYICLGLILWLCLLKSGVHPTIAGVLLALMIPHNPHAELSLLDRFEEGLSPWVAFLIMPIFALANAGFSFQHFSLGALSPSIILGIAAGLFIGKQIGVFGFCWALIKSGTAKLPQDASWLELYGVALLCGIGFTMSLFLGTLSFENENTYLAEVRLGVLIGSILSGITGATVLLIAFAKRNRIVA